jgi:glycosyltransferase involved in cell wall biosynthesis
MDKKKILIFIDWFYPGFRGGGPLVSCLNLIREINYDYEIFIFTRANDYTVNENYKDLELNKWIDFQAIANIYYCESSKLGFLKINQIINQVNPHIIYLNSMFSYYFTILPIIQNHFFLKNTNRKVILVPRGMLMDGKLQFNKIRKIVFLKTFRTLGLQKKLTLQVTSLEEKNASINRLAIRDNQVHLIPNIPSTYLLSDYQVIQKKSKQLKIYFSSRIAREKNILFALEVVSQLEFSVQFDIFGTIDHDAYWELCLAKIVKLPPNITVNYKGAYQANTIQEIFKPYHIFLFPTFGENYGHVIIEALALGKPVIITQNTPWIDLEEKKAGWIIDLENEKRYVEVLKSLFEMSQKEYNSYSMAAYRYACNHINEVDYKSLYRKLFD